MILTCTIGGVARNPLYEGFEIVHETGGANNTARFAIVTDPSPGKVGTAKVGTATVGFVPSPQTEVIITDAGATKHFGGYISKITPTKYNETQVRYDYECQGYAILLHRTTVPARSYASQNDSVIISDLFTTYLPEIDTASLVSTVAATALDVEGESLAQVMDRICDLTGAEWTVDSEKRLVYRKPEDNAAPWGFSETPDNITTFAFERGDAAFSKDFSTPANRVQVIGAVVDGANLTATAEDLQSQRVLGRIFSRTIVDRNLSSAAEATLRAQIEVARNAWPTESGAITYRKDGLDAGMFLPVTSKTFGISGTYAIRRLVITQTAKEQTVYKVEFGSYRPELERLLIQMNKISKPIAKAPTYTPAAGSITAAHFAASIEPVGLVTATANVDGQLVIAKTTSVVYNTTDRKTYRWNDALGVYVRRIGAGDLDADSVTAGTIAAGAIRAVDAVFDTGAIKSADIESLSASKLTAGTIDASVITVNNLNANNVTAGTLNVDRIPNLSADKITTGTLNASNVTISNLSVSSVGGWSGATISCTSGVTFSAGAGNGVYVGSASSCSLVNSGLSFSSGSIYLGMINGPRIEIGSCRISDESGAEEAVLPTVYAPGYWCGASQGISGTRTVKDGSGNNKTVTITGGLITGWDT